MLSSLFTGALGVVLSQAAADPTDVATMFTAMGQLFTANPILMVVVSATAVMGVALTFYRKSKGASK